MTVGIDDAKIILFDRWPGAPSQVAVPADMTLTYAAAVADADLPCPVGTKVAIYQPTRKGYATFMFLEYNKGAIAAAAVKGICVPDTTGAAAGTPYIVTNTATTGLGSSGLIAIALATLVDGDRAFFWVGGVSPIDTVPTIDGIIKSDGTLTAGGRVYVTAAASVTILALLAENIVASAVGVSLAVDTTS